ncbi:siphovirus Gp157 family protein [Aerosakkonema funiforme]|uniref:Siphovirus Gp157 family protein n=1 Tax=Aerosakkonema funiforme FACHB-1375 TaxID=2949571 RepID=A0A926VB08_9CYAN|nr:siphovirus Gp157 family protein [Aerosakkonema funiforme]MBD2180493.1 siphovirus Gp157 family protein [Aerosakkonema funiforme FACHB-1375]
MESIATHNGSAHPRTLFGISADLSQLNVLLDELDGDDEESKQLITSWLEELGEERDRKLDNYAALISELEAKAAVRKAEAKRLAELAAADEKRAQMLKERLKWFFEVNNLKTVDTARYKLSMTKHGGKAPLLLDESVSPTELPEKFQKITVEPDKTAIRAALEAGEELEFAQLGDRGTSIRIR